MNAPRTLLSGRLRRVLAVGAKGLEQADAAHMRLRAKTGRDLLRDAMLIQVEELRAQREQLKVELKATVDLSDRHLRAVSATQTI